MDKIIDKIGNAVGFVVVIIVLAMVAKNGLGHILNDSNQEADADVVRTEVIDQLPVDTPAVYEEEPVSQEPVYEAIGIPEFVVMVRDGQGVEEENPARWELEYKDKYKNKPISWRGKVESIFVDQCIVVMSVENPDFLARVDERFAALRGWYDDFYTDDTVYDKAYQECVSDGLDKITCSMSVFLTLEELASLNVGDEVLVQGNLEVYGNRDYNTSLYGLVESSSYWGTIRPCRLVENYGQ